MLLFLLSVIDFGLKSSTCRKAVGFFLLQIHKYLKQVDGEVLADKVYFRDCFYEKFNQLFLDGYLYVPILQPGPNNNLENKIRFSTYRPEEDVIKHLDKLRKYYKVDLFTGTMDFDKGKIDHIMPYDYDYVRIFTDKKVKITDFMELIQ